MKKVSFIPIFCLLLVTCWCFSNCKKEPVDKSNIVLHDKPLPLIEECIRGKWKLQYSIGGFSVMKVSAKYNQYMNLNSSHIVIGNDSAGVVVDTRIYWKRTTDIFNDRTYLLTSYQYSISLIVDRIYNDTLILGDNANDGFSYYYTKSN
jgi:hypothetical protein